MTKRHFDELAEDHILKIPEDRFRISLFNCVLNIVNAQPHTRIKGTHAEVCTFSVFFSANFINKEENIRIQEASSLHSKYLDDISQEFLIQLLSYHIACNGK